MHSIKKELITICEEVMEHNNKPYIESEGGISNHIFDEKGVQMYVGLELTKKLNLHFFSPPKVFFTLKDHENQSRKELMEMLWVN